MKEITSQKEFDELNSDMILIDFWASWCGPCIKMTPFISELESQYPNLLICKVNIDEADSKWMESLDITALPTFKIYKNGNEVGKVIGASEEKLKDMIENHV